MSTRFALTRLSTRGGRCRVRRRVLVRVRVGMRVRMGVRVGVGVGMVVRVRVRMAGVGLRRRRLGQAAVARFEVAGLSWRRLRVRLMVMIGRCGGVLLTLRLLRRWRLVVVRRRRVVVVTLGRVGGGRRGGGVLVGRLVVVVRRRVAVHGYRCLWLRRRSERLVEIVEDGEVGFDLGGRQTPSRMVERSVERRSFEVVTSVYDGTRDEVGVGFEDGRAVERRWRKAVAVDEKWVVPDC